jgi:S-formylglutathione hydrolase
MTLELISESACFGGKVSYYRHNSQVCQSEMKFAVYLPPQAQLKSVPILYYLSGLTCSEENFMIKAGAQLYAAEYSLMLVAPDTSPRNTGITGEDDDWDFGTGAGFYVDATTDPWKKHYRMYSYVVKELPALIHQNFPVKPEKQGIFGHSMGGHGALICGLKNPQHYQSISAFAPIAAPMGCPWGQKAFRYYLGEDRDSWRPYDASELVSQTQHPNRILIDQGTGDNFLSQGQLLPEVFQAACDRAGQSLTLRMQAGYDHSYYFISTFMGDHIRHHAALLNPDD